MSSDEPAGQENLEHQSKRQKADGMESKEVRYSLIRCDAREQSVKLLSEEPSLSSEGNDPVVANYGEIPLNNLQSKEVSGRVWTQVKYLTNKLKDKAVLIRGRAQAIHAVGTKMAFVVVREGAFTVQCVLTLAQDVVSLQMLKFATSLTPESIVDVEGVVSLPSQPNTATSQQVEIQVRKLYCVVKADRPLPFNFEEIGEALQERMNQDTPLIYRFLQLRSPANQGIFRVKSQVQNICRQFLSSEGFWSPGLTLDSNEGGAALSTSDYNETALASLAQSNSKLQLQHHKSHLISGGLGRVFVIGPVFGVEDSSTHQDLCESIGIEVEMEIKEHYSEVMDILDRLFVKIFDTLNENCAKELEAIKKQYPFQELKYLQNTLRLTFEEGVEMLKQVGIEIDPFGDLNAETERKLGQLVLEKHGTEFYILHCNPLAIRPFYTMPYHDNPKYSNSFDVFIRGEKIISGAQHVHEPEFLKERAQACGIEVDTISTYMDCLRYGTPPHGGFGVGLERLVMLFCALDDIHKTSLFPSYPQRVAR